MTASPVSNHSSQQRSLKVRPGRPEVYLVKEKGALVVVRPDMVFVFRARPVELWVQGEEDRTWRRSRGDGLSFSWGKALRSALRNEEDSSPNRLPLGVARRQALEHEEMRAFADLLDPRVIRESIRWRNHEWRICEFLCTEAAALELAESNPGLAFGLAHLHRISPGQSGDTVQAAATLAGERRRQICTRLGLPDTAAAVRMLSRVPRETLDIDNFLALRATVHEPEKAALLGHIGRVNAGVISLVSAADLHDHLSPAFLDDVGRACEYDLSGEGIRLMVSRYSRWREAENRQSGSRIRSLHQLHTYLARFQSEGEFWPTDTSPAFPAPPIGGMAEIEPLTSYEALVCEGRVQGNCVGSPGYAYAVCEGSTYFYAVHNPERCTLQILRDPLDGFWKVLEISTRFNQDPSPDTMTAVRCWLSAGNAALEKEHSVDR